MFLVPVAGASACRHNSAEVSSQKQSHSRTNGLGFQAQLPELGRAGFQGQAPGIVSKDR